MRLEQGTIILESAIDQNITFWARGRGAVNMHTETGVYSLRFVHLQVISEEPNFWLYAFEKTKLWKKN